MIQVQRLSLRAGQFQLRDLSFEVPAGAYAVLMGKTGSGKTTILEALCGLRPIQSGQILLDGRDVTSLAPGARGIGYVPQDRALFQTMTVFDNLAFGLVVRRWSPADIARRVEELAALLDIQPLLQRKPEGLSGGEAQRVALGRALAIRPGILCLDEPLSALDDDTRAEMYQLLKSVKRLNTVSVLHVTHHLGEAAELADRVLKLDQGTIKESVINHPPPDTRINNSH
ncbi:MAG: ATP-binding cassette domain-containing protein [Verrucomicrobiota bacterium]